MKPIPTIRRFLALAGSSLLAVSSASAQSTWDGSENNLWSTALNWNTAPVNAGAITFSGTSNKTNTNDTALTHIGLLTLSNAGWNIGLGTLTLNSGITAAGASTLGGTLTLGGAQTWQNTTAATTLAISGTINNNGFLLDVSGAGNTAISSVISGVGGLRKTGAGILTLSNANTYTGATIVNVGTLILTGARTDATAAQIAVQSGGILEVNNASLNFSLGTNPFYVGVGANTSKVNHIAGKITVGGSGDAMLIGNTAIGEYNLSGGTLSINFSSTAGARGVMLGVNDNSTATFNLSGTGLLEMTNSASTLMIGRTDVATSGLTTHFNQTGGEAKIERLKIGGFNGTANNLISNLTLSGGKFTALRFDALGEASGTGNITTITIGGTADVTLPAFRPNKNVNHTVNVIFDGGVLKNRAASTDYFGNITSAQIKDGGAKFDTTAGNITIIEPFQNFTGHTGKLTKEGTNSLTLAGANTYTGATTITAGTLVITGATQGTSSITFGSGGTGVLGLDTGSTVTASGAAVNLTNGKIKVTGTTGASSYTLLSASSITGSPLLTDPITGYTLQVVGGTELRLVQTGGSSDPYEAWAGPGVAFGADANGDGIENGLAFLLGAPSPTSAVTVPTVTQASGNLVLSFQCLKDAYRGSAALSVEHSNSLGGPSDPWLAALVSDAGTPANNVVFSVSSASTTLNNVTATINASEAGGTGKLFGRLRAAQP